MAAAARSGGGAGAAELRMQLEAHTRLSAQWHVKAAKLLERVCGLQQRSTSPGGHVPGFVSQPAQTSGIQSRAYPWMSDLIKGPRPLVRLTVEFSGLFYSNS